MVPQADSVSYCAEPHPLIRFTLQAGLNPVMSSGYSCFLFLTRGGISGYLFLPEPELPATHYD